MSDGIRMPFNRAMPIAEELAEKIAPAMKMIQIAGSLRRRSVSVGDVEIVAVANVHDDALALLDALERGGHVTKADYGGMTRWGDLYRGMVYRGVRVEIFFANEHSWGYKLWLRTGPGDGNQYVMQWLQNKRSAIRFHDGMAWITRYRNGDARYEQPVSVPDEATLFMMLGLPFASPVQRTLEWYRRNDLKPMSSAELMRYAVSEDEARKMPGQRQQLKLF